MPRLDSAVELEGSGGDIGCGSGVALDTEMHDHHAGDNTSNKGATLTATTTTKQAIPPPSIHDHHPGSDLLGLALESHQLPLPPHHTGTRSCSPPLSRSRSRSPSISSHPPLPQSSDYDHVGAPPRTKHPEEACVTVAVHESTHLPRAICLNVDANGNGSTSGMTNSVYPRDIVACLQNTNWCQSPQYHQNYLRSCLLVKPPLLLLQIPLLPQRPNNSHHL